MKVAYVQYCVSLILILNIFSCGIDNSNGNILVEPLYNGKKLEKSDVYLKSGTRTNPGVALSLYDTHTSTSADGEAYIRDQVPGEYYIYVEGEYMGLAVKGESNVKIVPRYRQNEYHLIVYMHQ